MLKIHNSITKLHPQTGQFLSCIYNFSVLFKSFYLEANSRVVSKKKQILCWNFFLLRSVLHGAQLSHKLFIFETEKSCSVSGSAW